MKKVALITAGLLPEDAIYEPLRLGYLAAYLKQRGIEVKIIDELAGDNIKLELAEFAPEFVGVSATTPVVNDAYRLLTFCRQKGYTTIIGGVHASLLPEEAKQYADYVVVGEGEAALHSIVTEGPPRGIVKGRLIENIDDLPFIDRSLMKMEFYFNLKLKDPIKTYHYRPKKKRSAGIITSRGCPCHCIFCYNSWRDTPARHQSAERIVREIVDIKNKYAIDDLDFVDDELFIDKRRILDMCGRLERARLNVTWSANARVSSVDKEVLDAAYSAGCRQINYGIESGSQRIVDTLKKGTTLKQAEEALWLTKKARILVQHYYMIGFPGETRKDIKKTKDFILKHRKYIDIIALSIATPYPGTALWYYAKAHNLIPESFTWDSFTLTHGGFSVNEFFSIKQLAQMRFWILVEMFFRFNIRFSFYLLKHPFYFATKLVDPLNALLGTKYGKAIKGVQVT